RVAGDERDTWVIDFSLSHLVGPVVHVDPPFSAIGAAELPLVARMHSLCLLRLETLAHPIEHLLRCRSRRLLSGRAWRAQHDNRDYRCNRQGPIPIVGFHRAFIQMKVVPLTESGCPTILLLDSF